MSINFKDVSLLCEKCEYVHFMNCSNNISHLLYESDNDYNDDLNVANDFNDLIHWNHKKALKDAADEEIYVIKNL